MLLMCSFNIQTDILNDFFILHKDLQCVKVQIDSGQRLKIRAPAQ